MLARQHGISLRASSTLVSPATLVNYPVARRPAPLPRSTRNFRVEPAMTQLNGTEALDAGRLLAARSIERRLKRIDVW